MKLLIIEDDPDLREGLMFAMEADGHLVTVASGKKDGCNLIRNETYDMVLLDCNLPDGDGFSLCKEIRGFSVIPIIMLTARDTEIDEIRALELGADDFISKPFSLAILKTRMKSLMRRRMVTQELNSNGITVDKEKQRVYQGGEEIELSSVEYKLLCYFMENRGRILEKGQIINYIWDSEGKFVDDNIVSVNVARLRKKIEKNPTSPKLIKTVHGMGYIWKEG